ncbi:MAG: Gfo/Idh/MocA family oxidoreductase [Spirochaetales bacterium]|nr:Gfo/Idh/MocA family oxidoreductase [Spirochaetales bacterium]
MGTGGIAEKFVEDGQRLADFHLTAVGSRSQASAQRFAGRFHIPHAFSRYEDLVHSPDVDVIYVATPHPWHYPHTMLALSAGKAVLVEKPFAMNALQARAMISAARSQKVFLMEAMWTRFLPHVQRIRKLLSEGLLGTLMSLQADHGQSFVPDPKHRLFDPALGGGALLDLGIYPVSFASLILGKPQKISAVADFTMTGVDAQTSMIFQYASGAHAVLTTTLSASTPTQLSLTGTKARLEVATPFYVPSSFRVLSQGRPVEEYNEPYVGNGLREEAAEVIRCWREGKTESPLMPLEETLEIIETLDTVREQIGLSYPL